MRKFLSLTLVSVLLLSVISSVAFADYEDGSCCGVAKVDVNFRESNDPDSEGFEKISLIPSGSVVTVLYVGSYWLKILYNGQIGYSVAKWFTLSPHDLVFESSDSADCEDETYQRYYCTLCEWEKVTVIPAPGHDLFTVYVGSDGVSSYNCESGGYRLTSCKRDLCSYEVWEEIPPGHTFTEILYIKPTYHSTGTQTLQCDYCGYCDYITIPVLVDDGMSPDVFEIGQAFMGGIWKLFGVYVPGFGFTFGGMFIGIALVSLSLSVIYMIFGFGRRGGGVSARTGSTNKPKISKERSDDEF